MPSLNKSYHHYEASTCVARYPIKVNSEGVWLYGPIRVVRDKDGNVEYQDRKVMRDGQPATESVAKWDETHANEIYAGPFPSESEAINAIRRKLAPKPRAVAKAQGSDAFAKWKKRGEPEMAEGETTE